MKTVLWVLMAFPGPGWEGSLDLTAFRDPAGCERLAAQLQAVPRNTVSYSCRVELVHG